MSHGCDVPRFQWQAGLIWPLLTRTPWLAGSSICPARSYLCFGRFSRLLGLTILCLPPQRRNQLARECAVRPALERAALQRVKGAVQA
jgi:hypothetical protein